MDTITHTLFGLTLYGTVDKKNMDKNHKRAYLLTAVGASLVPDIDVISSLWDTTGQYQMWHRGITHSIFLTPLWAAIIFLICAAVFKVRDKKLFFLGWLAVFIHDTSDLFNAWGTGYLEPFSNARITFGTIPIIDLVFWTIMGIAFVLSRKNKQKAPADFKTAWILMLLHFMIQSIQGFLVYNQYDEKYDQVALSAEFVPWTYSVIVKQDDTVTIFQDNLFQKEKERYVLVSDKGADLDYLFSRSPEAKTLYEWSPFVVVVDDGKRLGLYDPRFYREGQSFLYEYIER
ncbi:metal-dependent hydrolase [Planococcus shenhongbingii]|uniref:metal-dependent hydrolase n=1 Tax=Planococcus shenhongbingii TaxID=3058398 RepID=UPI00260E393C|nr:metal-dependent hydrolase [Planococcus sp. N016]WKA59115.1 metal-dependent hydrolase [Planococcus sp. N016]